MAEVTLQGVYITPADDFDSQVILNSGVAMSGSNESPGEFRRGAHGRTRLITRAGDLSSLDVSATNVPRATRETLDGWRGRLMLLRDGRGRLMFGSFLAVRSDENPGRAFSNITFTFTEVTHSVEV